MIDPSYVPHEQREPQLYTEEKYHYTLEDRIKDAVASVLLAIGFFGVVWVAFALDVITTGM